MAIGLNRLLKKDLSANQTDLRPLLPYDETGQLHCDPVNFAPDSPHAWFRFGQSQYAAKDYLNALGSFLTAYYFSGSKKLLLFWAGLALEKLKRYRQALKCFQAAKRHVDPVTAINNIAVCHARLGEYRIAIRLLKKATQLKGSQSSTTLSNLGSIFLKLGEPQKAISLFQQGLKIDPGDCLLLTVMGMAYEAMGNDDMADQWYLRALELDPAWQEALKGRVRCLLGTKRAKQALDCVTVILKQNAFDPEGWWFKGLCHDRLGEYHSAIDCYNHALMLRASTKASTASA